MNLILIKSRNGLKNVNVDRLLFIYINERILNRPSGPGKKKLSYTHGVLASDEELAELKDLLLQNQDSQGGEGEDLEDGEDLDEKMADAETWAAGGTVWPCFSTTNDPRIAE